MSRGTHESVRPHRDDLMGAKEAAAYLGVPRSSLSRWLESGAIRPYGQTKATPVFRRADLKRFRDKRARQQEKIERAREARRAEMAAA